MSKPSKVDYFNEVIGEVATEISQAYAEFGDLTSYYLGQTSSTIQLGLFQPLALEASLFLVHLLMKRDLKLAATFQNEIEDTEESTSQQFIQERLDAYAKEKDAPSLFTEYCQQVVRSDANYLSMQRRDDRAQPTISDKGYVAIQKAVIRLIEAVETI
ncbi:MAG: hypothetical protein WC136_11765 [Sphaerochaeta sp.]